MKNHFSVVVSLGTVWMKWVTCVSYRTNFSSALLYYISTLHPHVLVLGGSLSVLGRFKFESPQLGILLVRFISISIPEKIYSSNILTNTIRVDGCGIKGWLRSIILLVPLCPGMSFVKNRILIDTCNVKPNNKNQIFRQVCICPYRPISHVSVTPLLIPTGWPITFL